MYCCSDSDSRAQRLHCRDLEPFTLDPSVHCMDQFWRNIKGRQKQKKQIAEGKEIASSISRRHATGNAHHRANQRKSKGKSPVQQRGAYIKKENAEKKEAIKMKKKENAKKKQQRERCLLFAVISLSVC